MRHTFLTALGRMGTPLTTLMELGRHCDPRLAKRYVHAYLPERAAALESLPDLTGEVETASATAARRQA